MQLFIHNTTPNTHTRLGSQFGPRFSDWGREKSHFVASFEHESCNLHRYETLLKSGAIFLFKTVDTVFWLENKMLIVVSILNSITWPRGYNTFSCSTQPGHELHHAHIKMPTIVDILTFIRMKTFISMLRVGK